MLGNTANRANNFERKRERTEKLINFMTVEPLAMIADKGEAAVRTFFLRLGDETIKIRFVIDSLKRFSFLSTH